MGQQPVNHSLHTPDGGMGQCREGYMGCGGGCSCFTCCCSWAFRGYRDAGTKGETGSLTTGSRLILGIRNGFTSTDDVGTEEEEEAVQEAVEEEAPSLLCLEMDPVTRFSVFNGISFSTWPKFLGFLFVFDVFIGDVIVDALMVSASIDVVIVVVFCAAFFFPTDFWFFSQSLISGSGSRFVTPRGLCLMRSYLFSILFFKQTAL